MSHPWEHPFEFSRNLRDLPYDFCPVGELFATWDAHQPCPVPNLGLRKIATLVKLACIEIGCPLLSDQL